MRKYFINGREVTKAEWSETFKRFPDAAVVLRIDKLPPLFERKEGYNVISPERAKEIANQHKNAPKDRT